MLHIPKTAGTSLRVMLERSDSRDAILLWNVDRRANSPLAARITREHTVSSSSVSKRLRNFGDE